VLKAERARIAANVQRVGFLLEHVKDSAILIYASLHLNVTIMVSASVLQAVMDPLARVNAHVIQLVLKAATMELKEQANADARLALAMISAMRRSSGATDHGVLVMVFVGNQMESKRGL
jgi:hypothetical protein